MVELNLRAPFLDVFSWLGENTAVFRQGQN